jgi:hypothetical protein
MTGISTVTLVSLSVVRYLQVFYFHVSNKRHYGVQHNDIAKVLTTYQASLHFEKSTFQ